MPISFTQLSGADVDIQTLEADPNPGGSVYEFEAGFDAETALVLIEQLEGNIGASVQGIPDISLSKYERVKVYLARRIQQSQTLTVSVTSRKKSTVRITLCLLKGQISGTANLLPCAFCERFLGTLGNTMLAVIGVPYLQPCDTMLMPDGLSPDEMESMRGPFYDVPDLLKLGTHPTRKVPVLIYGPLTMDENQREAIKRLIFDSKVCALTDLIGNVGSKIWNAIVNAFASVDWKLDDTNRPYELACQSLGVCPKTNSS
ncbi:MAG: hypothetical protein ACHQRJ_17330 [Alphaproteobacteria bacterium]